MRPQKRCKYCRRKFDPYPSRYNKQDACSRSACQKQRRRATNSAYHSANRYDNDYRWEKNKVWQEKNGRTYMRGYRKENQDYVKRNREQQKKRDRKKRNLVKQDVWKRLHSGKIMRIHVFEPSCKVRRMRLLPE